MFVPLMKRAALTLTAVGILWAQNPGGWWEQGEAALRLAKAACGGGGGGGG